MRFLGLRNAGRNEQRLFSRRRPARLFPGSFFFIAWALLSFLVPVALAQHAPPVSVTVDFAKAEGELPPIWSFFGYDEPNYTYTPQGKKLLGELASLSPVPVYIRTHNLLTSGDGAGSLKWGSTNVYTEDASGNPVYSWTIVDKIFDAYRDAGVKPLVELGFMPEALSTHPLPYKHSWPTGEFETGWSYPPKDYKKWGDLIFALTDHLRERYGDSEVKTWLWEVWNEPDGIYWKGSTDDYLKLYDYSADAVMRALPSARVGGPDITGPSNEHAAEFLRRFLKHCAHENNFATGRTGAPLTFISIHPKGRPKMLDGHVRMGMSNQLRAIDSGFKIVATFPEWKDTPIILGESDPEGCAACSAKNHPENAYRNGPLFPTYTAVVLNSIFELAKQEHVRCEGIVTWSFQFDDQPYFEGLRELATNGVDKPILNAFRIFGLLGTNRISLTSSANISASEIQESGVLGGPDVSGFAARRENEMDVLLWNYHDDDLPAPDADINLTLAHLPQAAAKALVEHYRIDRTHSNSFTAWQQMGSPQQPAPEQYKELERAGQLQLLESPSWMSVSDGAVNLKVALPRQALSLIRISW
jgi:xylan 1,4-beta-xylosidase